MITPKTNSLSPVSGFFAILDQGIFSGSNFILNILIARFTHPDGFGAFALSFAIIAIFQQLHSAAILDPMSILYSKCEDEKREQYFFNQAIIHIFLTSLFCVFVFLIANLFSNTVSLLRISLLIWGVQLPFYLTLFYLRRKYYIFNEPQKSATISIIYSVSLFILFYIFKKLDLVNQYFAILILGLSSFVASFLFLNLKTLNQFKINFRTIFSQLKENWSIGKWLIFSAAFIVIALQAQIYLSGYFLGLNETGALKALQSLIQPSILSIVALSTYLLPQISRDFSQNNHNLGMKKVFWMISFSLIISVLYEIFLIIFCDKIVDFLFAGKYSQFSYLVPLLGLHPIIFSLANGLSTLHLAAKFPKALFITSLLWVISNLVIGSYLIIAYSLLGAVLSILIGQIITLISFGMLYLFSTMGKLPLIQSDETLK